MSMIDFPLADLFDGSLSLIWLKRFLRSWMRVDTRLISRMCVNDTVECLPCALLHTCMR